MKSDAVAWMYLIVGGMFETVWATTMFISEGFSKIPWTVVTVAFLFVSTWFLDLAYKRGIPTGVGYAVWVGIGGLGSVVVGIILFGEPATPLRLLFVLLVLVGIGGLEMSSKRAADKQSQVHAKT
ncbi:MAG: multidrug efflux SMR transporter [Candidatus Methanomethylophilaceae archaeon]|nr:quaternary ammonium compound-resistance protein SugE [Candidatus Methanomethylophilaceae archaeon]